MANPASSAWSEYVGHTVVLDMCSPYVILGQLTAIRTDCLVLVDVDVHDLRETTTTREKYVLDSRMHGIRVNRRQAMVRLADVVSISRLEDVVAE